jgi:diacylglycerol O-acyltransferase
VPNTGTWPYRVNVVTPIDPSSVAFLIAESRNVPMHVGGLQLFEPPEDAGPEYVRGLYEQWTDDPEIAPLFLKHPKRSLTTAGQYVWSRDEHFDIEHHVRHNALPNPGRVRELLELVSRLHGQRLAHERPLWEAHLIEGLRDGRIAMYTKMHHSLVDGVSAMRLLQNTFSTDPDERDMPAPWAPRRRKSPPQEPGKGVEAVKDLAEVPVDALRSAIGVLGEAAGMPSAFVRTMRSGLRNETSAVSFSAPRTIFNQNITGARRFAAQDWELDRFKRIGKATGSTLNDVVLALCSGALRRYLVEQDALPDKSLVAMVPVGLDASNAHAASASGGNKVGALMVRLGTDEADPADRLRVVHESMKHGKEALGSMSQMQIIAMAALGVAPAVLWPALRVQGMMRPPFNLVISNVPGPRQPVYYNGAKLVGMYPASIPLHGQAMNITCCSYDDQMGFGLTGCRRTAPHLQHLLTHLDDELALLEQAAGVS